MAMKACLSIRMSSERVGKRLGRKEAREFHGLSRERVLAECQAVEIHPGGNALKGGDLLHVTGYFPASDGGNKRPFIRPERGTNRASSVFLARRRDIGPGC